MKWEYTTVVLGKIDWDHRSRSPIDEQQINERLNRLGDEGWELVSVLAMGDQYLLAVLNRRRE